MCSLSQFGPPSGGQLQRNDNSSSHYQPLSQMNISSFPVGGQPWLLAGSQAVTSAVPVQQIGEQSSATTAVVRVRKDCLFYSLLM